MSEQARQSPSSADENQSTVSTPRSTNVRRVRFSSNELSPGNANHVERRHMEEEEEFIEKFAAGGKLQPAKWFMKCPRCCALVFGMVLPLWLLIGISFGFGYGLAALESPAELEANDDVLRNQALALFQTSSTMNLTQNLPLLCLELYVSNRTFADVAEDILVDILPNSPGEGNIYWNYNSSALSSLPNSGSAITSSLFLNANATTFNTTLDYADLLQFLRNCSQTFESYLHGFIQGTTAAGARVSTQDLSFNWNRCPLQSLDGRNNTLDGILQNTVILQGASADYRKTLLPVRDVLC
jgi:hypothetical protein